MYYQFSNQRFFLGKMRRFQKLSSNSSLSSASEEQEAEHAIKKGLPLIAPMHLNKMNDLN